MNKTELRNFAVSARRDLLEKVALRGKIFGIDAKNGLTIEEKFGQLAINGETYPIDKKSAFLSLKKQLEIKGYEQLLEEVAYTWFNRIIAIRYMEVNEYLPDRVNVLSSSTGKVEPDILSEFESMDLDIDKTEIKNLIRQAEIDNAYRRLFIAQCNALNSILPFMFEKIHDYTELLLPDFLLDSESVISQLVKNVSKDNFHNEAEGKDNVEVLGWLFQYYMSEKKEKIGGLKNNSVKKEDLPVVTQLFTPKWIVQYMVQNSLGKLYDEKFPDNSLVSNWEYYPKYPFLVKSENKIVTDFDSFEEIKVIDPACGSGHILLYAFDLLYDMYEEAGYPPREIPKLILENNLYGLDIDKRAQQIANFALVMKIVEKQPRFLKKNKISLNILEIIDSDSSLSIEAIELIVKETEEIETIRELQHMFQNGKQFGSLLVPANLPYQKYIKLIENFEIEQEDLVKQAYILELKDKLLPLLKQAWILTQKYDVVITNPPYHNKYNPILKAFVNKSYTNYKSDLYSAFLYRTLEMTKINGYTSLMTPFTWMFIASHEILRKYIIDHAKVSSLIQLEYSAFTEATVPICTFVLQNQNINTEGIFIRLSDFKGEHKQPEKVIEAIKNPKVNYLYIFDTKKFANITGSPFAYWASNQVQAAFLSNPSLGSICSPKIGMQTNDNNRFLRLWHEVDWTKLIFNAENFEKVINASKKWVPINKGGAFRKWYGNKDFVVNWEDNGKEIKKFNENSAGGRIVNEDCFFRPMVTWSAITSSLKFSVRYFEEGSIISNAARSLFSEEENLHLFLGFLNSKIAEHLNTFLSPTLNSNAGDVAKLPIILPTDIKQILKLTKENVRISKEDWNSFELSWDFKIHPFLINNGNVLLSNVFINRTNQIESQFTNLKNNEEELNRIFINLYSLHDELNPEVSEEEITIFKADRKRDTKSFLSYFIGCVLGRFSLDIEGVAYAGGEWDDSKYKSFIPNKFGLIQLTNEYYFEDDIIARLHEFLSVTFGTETIDENLQWLAESLELRRNETADERLRRYFLDEFFKDHCQLYQKRPFYWLVDSGNQKGLRTLIYMHRYLPDTMATIRFEHLQEIQAKYNNEIAAIDLRIVNPNLSATEKRDLEKRKSAFQKRLEELLEFDKKLAEYANAQIAIDLDDGVKVNYEKFDKVLAKIK